MDLSREVGQRIKHHRDQLGLTQEELGRRLASLSGESRFSTSMVSLLEAGSRPIKLEDILLFAQALDTEPVVLLDSTVLATTRSDVKRVFLRSAHVLHPGAQKQLEEFFDEVQSGPSSPAPVLKLTPAILAEELVQGAGYREPPVDPADLAQKAGLRVVQLDLDEDISGVLVVSGDRRAIGVNGNQARPRQRFTIAHELAHFVKQHSPTVIDAGVTGREWSADSGASPLEEHQANTFAAELLMPSTWVEKDFRLTTRDHEDLATRYEVSAQAMWIRLLELGLVS